MDWAALLPKFILAVTVLSIVTLVGAVVAVPWVVKKLPQDYFSQPRRQPLRASRGAASYLLALFKNLLGALLVGLGILMLVTPGQGVLTLLVGLLLMNFPGKYRLERALVARSGVLGGLNWMRRRQGLPDFDPPHSED